jgi:ferric iron reductase protein FhuF
VTMHVEERLTQRAAHPLLPDLGRTADLSEFFRAELGRPRAGWLPLENLTRERRILDDVLRRNQLTYRGTRRIAANFVAGGITWAATAAAVAMMSTRRRAIAPDPHRTFVHVDARGEASGVFYDDPSFCVLASDPAAGHERAEAVDGVSEMHDWMRSRLIESLSPFVDALSDLSGLGRKGLWGQVTGSWGSLIVWAAELGGAGSEGVVEAEAFLASPASEFRDIPTFYRIDHRDRQLVAVRRGVCCLAYKLADHAYCGSCPLISNDERTRRFCDEADQERA